MASQPDFATAKTSDSVSSNPRGGSIEPTSPRDILLLAVAALAVASASPLAKGCVGIDAFGIGAGRCLVGSLALFLLGPRATLRALSVLGRRGAASLIAAGALLAAHFAFFLGGLAATSLPAAVALVSLEPLAVVAMAWLAFGFKPRFGEWIGLGLAVLGALVVTSGAGSGENRLLGDALVLGSVALFGAYLAATRALRDMMPVMPYAAAVYGVAAIVLLPIAFFSAHSSPATSSMPPLTSMVRVVAMGLVPTLIGHTLTQRLARKLSPSVVALVPAGETVGAIAMAAVFSSKFPTRLEMLGTVVILLGAVAVSRSSRATTPGAGASTVG